MREEMHSRGLSFRALAQRTRDHDPTGRGLNYAFLSDIVRGRAAASVDSMELIARALEIPACTFVEYRLAAVRHSFDERRVGLARARANAETLHRWIEADRRSQLADELSDVLDCGGETDPQPQPNPAAVAKAPAARRRRRPQKALTDDPADHT